MFNNVNKNLTAFKTLTILAAQFKLVQSENSRGKLQHFKINFLINTQ